MNTITLSAQDVKAFINSQSNRKRVNMAKNMINGSKKTCGCLLVHLFQNKFPEDKGSIFAAYTSVDSNSNRISLGNFNLSPFLNKSPKTYKQLKKIAEELN